MHFRVNAQIIGRRSQHQMAIFEDFGNKLGHICSGNIISHHIGHTLFAKAGSQCLCRALGVPVHRGISDQYAFSLRLIAAPDVIFFNKVV
ncbi:hypothetical protein SDC9_209158 [bioreactor metagenome]|uniref:Uncharacterized protein n=1 Tax=bioreactor metagenome TaxID=1076179 RepID=A0A645JCN3_9ZZZZ